MIFENVIYTQKTLAERYGISIAALQRWYPYADIVKLQKRGGYFDATTVEIADVFYVPIKIQRLTCEEYFQQMIPVSGLDAYLQKVIVEITTLLLQNQFSFVVFALLCSLYISLKTIS